MATPTHSICDRPIHYVPNTFTTKSNACIPFDRNYLKESWSRHAMETFFACPLQKRSTGHRRIPHTDKGTVMLSYEVLLFVFSTYTHNFRSLSIWKHISKGYLNLTEFEFMLAFNHDDVMSYKRFLHYSSVVKGNHWIQRIPYTKG